MDVVSKNVADGGTGFVVRQFLPSRIERQVLAQVFELICAQGSEGAGGQFATGSAVSARGSEAAEQMDDAIIAGRRAA